MTNTTHTDAAQVAKKWAPEITALTRYLSRTGYPAVVVTGAVAEAIAQIEARPDITRPMAYLTTVARGQAEILLAHINERNEAQGIEAPDLMRVLSGKAPRKRRAPARRRAVAAPAEAKPEQMPLA